jgi:structure-specific endonuclease subunit SLX1
MTENKNSWYCYILRTINSFYENYTYNGSTNDLTRRLRQHNGQIGGGAKATANKGPWEYYAILTGFDTHNEALSCEWRIKHPTGKRLRPKKYCGVNGRIEALNLVLNLEKWTNNSTGLESGKKYTLYLANDIINIIKSNEIKENIIIKSIDELFY